MSLFNYAGMLWTLRRSFDLCCWSLNSPVYILHCRQTRDQDERSHLLPSHRRGVLWPFKERAQGKSVYVNVCVPVCVFLARGILHKCLIFAEHCWHLFPFSPSIYLSPSHACTPSPLSLLFAIISPFFPTKLHSPPRPRAPTPRWPSAWRPPIGCTTWWLRRLRPCVSGWMLWLRAPKDTCISWCNWPTDQDLHRLISLVNIVPHERVYSVLLESA